MQERPDVKTAFAGIIGSRSHISRSGFDVTAPLPEGIKANSRTIVRITPYTPDGARLDPLQTHFFACRDEISNASQPPIHLQERIGGSKDFARIGANVASLVLTYVGKYKPISEPNLILDWGCGCGRVITQLMKFVSPERLHGCDIDSEAIAWNKENIPGPTFNRIDPYPPTSYPDSTFDVVYGISVMTHLEETTQVCWLKELRRITRPGAILVLSVMGEKLRDTNMPASLAAEFGEKGFVSFVSNYSELLAGFSHYGYYREAYHTVDYIESNWSRYFDVVEYIETKHQDLVILRAN